MAINQNHTSEELNGIKCAIVEKLVTPGRTEFLKNLLTHNGFTVVVADSPPPKTPPVEGSPPLPPSFTVGVTDVTFNPINAVFGRLLKTPEGDVVTLKYWQQKETIADDTRPYFQKK